MKNRWIFFGTLVTVVTFLWASFWFVVMRVPGLEWEQRGQFGDMFGALNALFSGLALAGVIFALYLQMEELALQREEMKNSREELAKTAKAQSEQVQILADQLAAMKAASQSAAEKRKSEIQPVFQYVGAPASGQMMELKLVNRGGLAKDLTATSDENLAIRVRPPDAVPTDREVELRIEFSGAPPRPMHLNIRCYDIDGNDRLFRIVTDPWAATFTCREVPIP